MGGSAGELQGPDLTAGVEAAEVPEGGTLLGHAHGEAALLFRRGEQAFAVGATCTHYSGPLAEGLVVGGEVHCPWHHACFDLRTGQAVGAPALRDLPCWRVERQGTRLFVRGPLAAPPPKTVGGPTSVVIVGAGAAGNAAAETLRREGYAGPVTMIGADESLPCDRPNLSKDYLAGTAPEEWIPLRDPDFYKAQNIDLLLGTRVTALDTAGKTLTLSDGSRRGYGALLLATGADPVKLTIPGADKPHVMTLRTLADSRRIIARATAQGARRAVVIGASFIGLEVAGALRTRGLEVAVVGPEARPLERVLGPALGDFIRALHEEHGVRFHLQHTPRSFDDGAVVLDDGQTLPCDLVVTGVGVRPQVALAEQAGLRLDRGVAVDGYLATSAPDIFAAGDIARWPDARSGQAIRVEHWVVAERQGQTVARNILGRRQRFSDVPFFWSQHYDVPIAYVGHAEGWDSIHVAGSIAGKDCLVGYRSRGRIAAVASIYRDQDSLKIEAAMARDDDAAIEALFTGAQGQ